MYSVSILIQKRKREVPEMQEILTKYGQKIIARLGLHVDEDKGMILVVYKGENVEKFIEELKEIANISVNYMKV